MDLTAPEAAEQRRSIRKYTSETIPESELRDMLRLAGRAPSAWNLQPWRFVVVRDPALKEQLMAVANKQAQVGRAPAVIVLYSDMNDVLAHLDEVAPTGDAASWQARIQRYFEGLTPAERAAWGNAQTFTALGWLLLIAESRGYATSPMLGFNPEGVKALLGLPPTAVVAALMAVGHGAEERRLGARHAVDRVAQFR
ncbi:MAG TPA: nitroreductase family protein [Gemmatimonadaceae bacterium]|nr:nitroreductase family protein [Gemmatimonadaceae bacterium]